jgi:limonene-1,2-epoxide hydrolase
VNEQVERSIEVAESFLDAFKVMDFGTALSLLSDDVEYTDIPIGTVSGRQGVREVLGPFFAPIHENEFVLVRRAVSDSVVFIERLDHHCLDHGWRELRVHSVFEVHDGLITVWRDNFDLAAAVKIHEVGAL